MPHDADSPRAWLRFAESDLALAVATNDNRVLFENLCFHAQQTVEKSIKAVLVMHGIDFPKTHNIEWLLDLLPSDVERTEALLESRALSGYATVMRYPGAAETPSEDEYRNAVDLASAVFEWAKQIVDRAQ
jgi:HEPN domain-containing protein